MSTDREFQYQQEYRRKNKSLLSEKKKKYYIDNRDKELARCEKWRNDNKKWMKEYREVNKDTIRAKWKEWREKNRWRLNKIEAKRRGIKLSAILPTTDFDLINSIYLQRDLITKTTGVDHHVDHIIPLSKGGAHHQDNLRVIPASENCSKKDKHNSSLGGVWANNKLASDNH